MATNVARVTYTHARLNCYNCHHPLDQQWSEVEGLTQPDEQGGTEEVKTNGAVCPGCGRKNQFPKGVQ